MECSSQARRWIIQICWWAASCANVAATLRQRMAGLAFAAQAQCCTQRARHSSLTCPHRIRCGSASARLSHPVCALTGSKDCGLLSGHLPALTNLLAAPRLPAGPATCAVLLVGSTVVWPGGHRSAASWVDERTTLANEFRSHALLMAEAWLQQHLPQQAVTLRLGGIAAPGARACWTAYGTSVCLRQRVPDIGPTGSY